MVTVYTELFIKDQKHNTLAMLNHNQHENSNLIMPFLVQNENKMLKAQTTQIKDSYKKLLFLLKMQSISVMQIDVLECAWSGILKYP